MSLTLGLASPPPNRARLRDLIVDVAAAVVIPFLYLLFLAITEDMSSLGPDPSQRLTNLLLLFIVNTGFLSAPQLALTGLFLWRDAEAHSAVRWGSGGAAVAVLVMGGITSRSTAVDASVLWFLYFPLGVVGFIIGVALENHRTLRSLRQ